MTGDTGDMGRLRGPAKVNSHKDLIVWQKAMDLVDTVYDIAEKFPVRENYGLFTQLTRAIVSVPANIAEGRARSTAKDFANFLTIARSSLMEAETLMMVAVRRKYVSETAASQAFSQIVEVSKMLSGLRSRITSTRRMG